MFYLWDMTDNTKINEDIDFNLHVFLYVAFTLLSLRLICTTFITFSRLFLTNHFTHLPKRQCIYIYPISLNDAYNFGLIHYGFLKFYFNVAGYKSTPQLSFENFISPLKILSASNYYVAHLES